MVTLQAKQHQQQQQQRQRSSLQRDHKGGEKDGVVANGRIWNRRIPPFDVENNGSNDNDRTSAISSELAISNTAADYLETDNQSHEGRETRVVESAKFFDTEAAKFFDTEASATSDKHGRNNKEEVAGVGCNGGLRECDEIENDDEVEVVEEELEEEEEEDEVDYEVDVDTDDDDCDDRYEIDAEVGDEIGKTNGWMKKKVLTTRIDRQTSFGGSDGPSEVVPHLDETSFGKVCITNSKRVHVGNTNFYKGPVTIKQFVYTNAYPVLDKDDVEVNSSVRASETNSNAVPNGKTNQNGPILGHDRDSDKVAKFLWTWRFAALSCLLALSLVTIVAVISVLTAQNTDASSSLPVSSPSLPDSSTDLPDSGGDDHGMPSGSFRVIDRQFWNAQPPSRPWENLTESPTPFVIISHTATEPCFTQSICVLRVRLIQTFHIESFHWDDIGYNFLVGGDGLAYRGRGWDSVGAHAVGYNFRSIGISFIGTFNVDRPNDIQLRAARKLIELGVNMTKILPSYKLLAHRQVSKTESPGDALYKILQTWEHWSPLPRP